MCGCSKCDAISWLSHSHPNGVAPACDASALLAMFGQASLPTIVLSCSGMGVDDMTRPTCCRGEPNGVIPDWFDLVIHVPPPDSHGMIAGKITRRSCFDA